jgi:hypothetical protein
MNRDLFELHTLIHAGLDGHATDEQISRLNTLLRTDAAARDLYLQLADTHSCLAVDEKLWVEETTLSSSIAVAPSARQGRWFASLFARPITAAAVGLFIGLFSASVVFGFVIPQVRLEAARPVPIFADSFEDKTMAPPRGFPSRAGVWSGDLSGSIPTETDLKPKEGVRMVRLAPHDRRKFSYAWRIVDLDAYPVPEGAESRQVEVSASFHSVRSGMAERHQIRLAAFAEEPGEVKAIWNGENMFDQVLQHVGRTVTADPDNQDWKTLRATMEIPPEARSLVISLAAAMAEDSVPKTAHYLDDVHVQFLIKEGVQ